MLAWPRIHRRCAPCKSGGRGAVGPSETTVRMRAHRLSGALVVFFFFQAEDGIRDVAVTGVQTCALPICAGLGVEPAEAIAGELAEPHVARAVERDPVRAPAGFVLGEGARPRVEPADPRSEERRVGKECRSRWSPYH